MKRTLIIIPARYASTRFPGKPLALIDGKPMVEHVYKRCREVYQMVAVATDDERIAGAVASFGGEYVMTSDHHHSGTDRCAEAASLLASKYEFDIVINVQGDEPFIKTGELKAISGCFDDPATDIATLITPIRSADILFDPNKVKVVRSADGYALYFSRQPIPYRRDVPQEDWARCGGYFLHVGMYAFRPAILQAITLLEPSELEKAERLEQLRWMENGYRIKTELTYAENFGVDTPEDLEKVRNVKVNNNS
jgi:3-deoxy-manno-octulosonate cytidylyltransferase (CMP-KDO synthetase)